MKSHRLLGRWFATGAGLAAALITLSLGTASATPVMDGEKDAEYTLVGSSPKDNLSTDDAADPRYKSLDVTGFWAANTGTDLYLYIELPYFDPSTIAGEWAVNFHLKGANDAIMRAFAQDPFGAAVDYMYAVDPNTQPGVNVTLKSNMLGFLRDFDGNQGWSALVFANKAQSGWAWPGASQMIFTNGSVDVQQANNLVHGYGNAGGEIVYKGAKGIEVKIPFALFGVAPTDTDVTAPIPGDQILMQFYDNVRERTTPNYPRGSIDGAPFEAGIQSDPLRGTLTTWGSYTLTIPPVLELGGVALKDPLDLTHITLTFSEAIGTGATTVANYTVTNAATGAAIPISAATVDPADAKKVDLTFTIPYNTKLHVSVQNLQAASGHALSTTKNAADLGAYSAIQFNLYDPYGDIAALGATNPDTSQPYKLSVTGDPIGWRWAQGGDTEIPLNKISDSPLHYQSPIVLAKAGVFGFKYRIPELPQAGDYDNWNGLNPRDRRGFAPATSDVYQISDNAAGRISGVNYVGNVGDNPVKATFKLIDHANISQGRPVYITGKFTADTAFTDNNQWNADPAIAYPMTAVAGEPGTYTATIDLHPGYGFDTTTEYKYIIKPDPTNDPNNTIWDDLNRIDGISKNRFVEFHRLPDGQPAPVVDVIVSGPRAVRILRSVAGLDPVPQWGDYYTDQDADLSGNVTVLDAIKAAHP